MKSVLIVTPYKKEMGGVEIVTMQLARMLTEKNIKVDFLTLENTSEVAGVKKWMVKIFGPPYLTAMKFRQMRTDQYDAVICNGEYSWGIEHKNAVAYFHGSYLGLRNSKKDLSLFHFLSLSWRSWIQKKGAEGKKVVAVSGFLKKILEEQGVNVTKVISNCVDPVQFFPMKVSKDHDFVFAGRYDEQAKGFDLLSKLSLSGMDITCYTDNEKPKGNLRFKPFLPNHELNSELNRYKIFISASRFESFGMAAAEAMSAGLPVLVAPVGFGLELQSELPQFVINDFSDPAECKRRAEEIMAHYDSNSRLARDYAVKNFAPDVFIEKWMEVLNA